MNNLLQQYIFEFNQYNCIFDEYIYLEMLCRNTDFYDSDKMLAAMVIERNEINRLIFNEYYYNKIDYIKEYFNNNVVNLDLDIIER